MNRLQRAGAVAGITGCLTALIISGSLLVALLTAILSVVAAVAIGVVVLPLWAAHAICRQSKQEQAAGSPDPFRSAVDKLTGH